MPSYSGKWNLTEQMQATAAGTWTGIAVIQFFSVRSNTGDSGATPNADDVLRLTEQDKEYERVWDYNFGSQSVGVTTDDKLFVWGTIAGRITNDAVTSSSPVQLTSGSGFFPAEGVSGGSPNNGFIAPDSNGRLWVTGANNYGCLGTPYLALYQISSPVQVGALTNWSKGGMGGRNNNSTFIKTDGTLWTAGDASQGYLGNNQTTVHRSSPIQIGSGTDWYKLNINSQWSNSPCLALKTDGTLWWWGNGNNGTNGINEGNISRSSPVQVGTDTDWAEVFSASANILAIKTNGTLWGWGENQGGMLGLGTVTSVSSPTQIGALTNWAFAWVGSDTSYAWTTDGKLYAMGAGTYGEFGDNNSTQNQSSPVQVAASTLTNVKWATTSRGAFIVNEGTT
jgi:alpha-tubulin suppressor-like RCC1 family protein